MTLSVWSSLAGFWHSLWPILVAVVLFGLLVIFHEFGHFFFAKLFKVRVNEFSVGFGPALWKRQKGQTLYALRVIPFGGYCAMEGEDDASDDPGAFPKQPVWRRMIILAAGAFNNLVLGLVLVGLMLAVQGQFYTTTVAGFAKDAKSEASGLAVGDRIVSVDGRRVYCSSDLSYMLMASEDDTLTMEVRRNGELLTLGAVQFDMQTVEGRRVIAADFGIAAANMSIRHPLTFLKCTFLESASVARVVWMSLLDLIGGRFGLNDMMGPVGMVSSVSETVSEAVSGSAGGVGLDYLFYLMGMLTINLGVLNLLPLPALDGGRLVFLAIEAVCRKPVPARYEGLVHGIGLVLLFGLILIITGNDILRLIRG